jgi:predicted transcriptional regulator
MEIAMSPLLENEVRITKDWRQAAITTADRELFLRIARYLAENNGSSTYMAARLLDIPCGRLRGYLRRMERHGYVVARSNGFNNINWRLAS